MKLSTETFVARARVRHSDRFDYSLTRYEADASPITVICSKHGAFKTKPRDHLRTQSGGCRSCIPKPESTGPRITTDEFVERAKIQHSERFDYSLANYTGFVEPITIVCRAHGKFTTTPKHHLAAKFGGCWSCIKRPDTGNYHRLSQEEFLTRAKAVHGDRYDYSEAVYKSYQGKITLRCSKHGPFRVSVDKHLAGRGCRKCTNERLSKARRHSMWRLIERIISVRGLGHYDYDLRGYVNQNQHLRIRCHRHGWFTQSMASHLAGSDCSKCSSSRGEKRIRLALRTLGIDFVEQARFPECRDKRPLAFDFYIPTKRTLIEFDGTQHYYPSKRWGGQDHFETIQLHDAIKDRFAADYGYRLLRIPYWKKNDIEDILRQEFAESHSPTTEN